MLQDRMKGLLFDKDGTLFDFQATWGAWAGGFIAALADGDQILADRLAALLAFSPEKGEFLPDSFVVTDSMEKIIAAVHNILPDWDFDALFDFVNTSTCAAPQAAVVPLHPLFTGFKERGLKLGIATNDNVIPARAHLETAGVFEVFDFVAACDSGFGSKPDPGMLLAFSEAMDLSPENVAMVGDSAHDLKAGRAAGMVTIGVTTGTVDAGALEPFADVILPDIGHIPAWLDG